MGELLDLRTAMREAMEAALPGRVITRDYLDFAQRERNDLLAGVVSIIGAGEKDYVGTHGAELRESTVPMVVVGQILIEEATLKDYGPSRVEDAEDTLAEEIKAFVRSPGSDLLGGIRLIGFRQSGQMDAPYGWVACDIEVLT